jgi:hypothetical protein
MLSLALLSFQNLQTVEVGHYLVVEQEREEWQSENLAGDAILV